MNKIKRFSKQVLFIVFLAITLSLTTSCNSCTGPHFSCFWGSGIKASEKNVEIKNILKPFHKASLYLPCNITVKQLSEKDKAPYIIIEGPENYAELVQIHLSKTHLKINIKDNQKLKENKRLHVTLFIDQPEELCFKTVGDISIHPIKVKKLQIFNIGVSDIHVKQIIARELKINNTGVGNVKMSGKTETLYLYNTGVGDINTKHLEAKKLTAKNTGVGDMECTASEEAELYNTGVGDIKFKGNARISTFKNKGVGSIDLN